MLQYNTFTCYTWAGSCIRTGDYILLCVARNAAVQYIHLLHLGRLGYSHRWLHCSLCSRECCNICNTRDANINIQKIGRIQTKDREVFKITCNFNGTKLSRNREVAKFGSQNGQKCLQKKGASLLNREGWHLCNTFTCYTWTGSGIRTGDYIVLCVARNAEVQYIHLLHQSRFWYSHRWLNSSLCSRECCSTIPSPATPGQAPVFTRVIALFSV